MKKISILLIVFGIMFSSCGDKIKSFKEHKKDEREAIDNLIAREGFVILNQYPADSIFGEKEFVKLDNECYLNVIDSGNGNRADSAKTVVLMRCSNVAISKRDSTEVSNFPNNFEPMEFVYGNILEAKIRASQDPLSIEYYLLSPGVESALKYVGENAVVRMIIPFNNGQDIEYRYGIGSVFQDKIYVPMYLDRVRFVFDSH